MKKIFLLTVFIASMLHGFTQQSIDDAAPSCRQKCSHAHLTNGNQQTNYYQYSSMDKYDVKYLKLDIAVETGSTDISGSALTVVRTLQPLDSFITEFRDNMIVDSVFINGIQKIFQRGADHIFIPLSPVFPAGTDVSALIYYHGTASPNAVYAGSVAINGLTYTASLSESYQAREWFPVKQVLTDKFDSADIWVTTSDTNKVGSNGLLVNVVTKPGNKKQYQWKTRYPMNYYLPSFSAANYMEYINYAKPLAMAPDSIPVLHYLANDATYFGVAKPNMDKTPAWIEKYSELYGLYPFKNEKYGHSLAGIPGGMEHQTMSTVYNFGSVLIAHELAHQWWGDNVTCATWNHIWLNEGFAAYSEYLMIEKRPDLLPTLNTTTYMQNIHDNVMSVPDGSVYVPDASIFDENRIFSGRLTYNKGSAIIHTLRFELQSDTFFFHALQNYQTQYKNSVATADDFKHVVETTAGRNLDDFFNQWYYGEGYPTFNIIYIKQPTDSISLIINETVSAPGITPFFKGLYEFTIVSPQGDTTVLVNLTSNNQEFKFKYTKTPTNIIVDPNNWVLNQTGTITNATVVPIKLTGFNATINSDCSSVLTWKTSNETLPVNYIIEYSTDHINFIKAGELAGNGSSSYRFTYKPAYAKKYYFRLKITDANDRNLYSDVINVEDRCSNLFSVTTSPNPVKDLLNLSIIKTEAGDITLSLISSLGQALYKETKKIKAGESSLQLSIMQKLSAGTYMLKVKDEKGKEVIIKLVKE